MAGESSREAIRASSSSDSTCRSSSEATCLSMLDMLSGWCLSKDWWGSLLLCS